MTPQHSQRTAARTDSDRVDIGYNTVRIAITAVPKHEGRTNRQVRTTRASRYRFLPTTPVRDRPFDTVETQFEPGSRRRVLGILSPMITGITYVWSDEPPVPVIQVATLASTIGVFLPVGLVAEYTPGTYSSS